MAILPILIFHLDSSWMPGGFVGVDIFFVISGYLISGQIFKRGPGNFKFLPFYIRRFRRLFPALAVTVAVSLAAGWHILPPADFKALAWSALASLAGIANIHFYASVDYFNENALLHPLLHVWSLSVEEQFYLVWPAFLVLILPFAHRAQIASIAIVGLISFVASAIATFRAPYLAFYMMPFRIFEFAIGAMVFRAPVRLSQLQGLFCGLAGSGLLAVCLIAFGAATPWPGTHALFPSFATALILFAGRHGFWHGLLSVAPLRVIGRISYSLYLVHWPLIVLYRHWAVVPPSPRDLLGLFVISIAIGGLLFVCVERFHRISPEPKISWLFVGPTIVRSAGAAIENVLARRQAEVFRTFLLLPIATAGFGAMVILRDGFPERIKKWRVQQSTTELSFAGDMCNNSSNRCEFGEISSSRIVYLIGDSYALNLVFGLDRVFKDAGIRGIALYDHGCLFLKGTKRFISGVADQHCEKNVAFAFDQMARDRHPVILAGNYGGYTKSIGTAHADAPFDGSGADYFMWISNFFRDSLHAIDANNRPVIILADSYSTYVDTAKCAMLFGWEDAKCAPASLEQARQKAQPADAMLASLRGDFPRLNIIDPKTVFCTEKGCIVRKNGLPYFRDTSHLTNEGSAFLAERMKGDILTIIGSAR